MDIRVVASPHKEAKRAAAVINDAATAHKAANKVADTNNEGIIKATEDTTRGDNAEATAIREVISNKADITRMADSAKGITKEVGIIPTDSVKMANAKEDTTKADTIRAADTSNEDLTTKAPAVEQADTSNGGIVKEADITKVEDTTKEGTIKAADTTKAVAIIREAVTAREEVIIKAVDTNAVVVKVVINNEDRLVAGTTKDPKDPADHSFQNP